MGLEKEASEAMGKFDESLTWTQEIAARDN